MSQTKPTPREELRQMADELSTSWLELRSLGKLGVLLSLLILVFGYWTYRRNLVWRDPGGLWLDICNKTYAKRIIDPNTGRESPRMDRGRIYNNIGLYLYDQARFTRLNRDHLQETQKNIETAKKRGIKTKEQQAAIAELQKCVDFFKKEMNAYYARLLEHIPDEFITTCRENGFTKGNMPENLFFPVILCYKKALYHFPQYYISRMNLGLVYKLQDELEKAEEQFRLAHTFQPKYHKALKYHSQVLLLMKEYEEAREMAIRAIAMHRPSDGEQSKAMCMLQAAQCSMYLGDLKEAEKYYKGYITITEQSSRHLSTDTTALAVQIAYLEYADILGESGKVDEALAVIEAGLNAKPFSTAPLLRRKVTLLCKAGDYETALKEAQQAEKLYPGSFLGKNLQARALFYAGKIDESAELCDKIISSNPADWEANCILGMSMKKLGHDDAAINLLNRATELNPKAHEAWAALAEFLFKSGEKERAAQMMELAHDIHPSSIRYREKAEAYRKAAAAAANQK